MQPGMPRPRQAYRTLSTSASASSLESCFHRLLNRPDSPFFRSKTIPSSTMHSPSPQLLRAMRSSLLSGPTSRTLRSATSFPRVLPALDMPSQKRNYSSPIRPTRMIPRSHTHKPTSHDRGPESKEDTQTDFGALDVLGNTPVPSTAIDACLDSGFHLNSGVKITGGDALLLVGGEAFSWRPWKAFEGAENDRAAKASMINAKGQFELDEQAWGLLSVVWPRPGT